jgi:hypothetical protein
VIVTGDLPLTIIEASDGHPRRTMLIGAYIQASASVQPDRTATRALVDLAIRDAQADRAWT